MGKRDALTKTLAVAGTVLVALPLLAPFLLGLVSIGRLGGFRLDYLMPFEVYPVTVVGMILLAWAAMRAKIRQRAVMICIAVMLGGLLLLSVSAQATGIADSEVTLETWRYVVTSAFGVMSLVAQLALVAYGWLLGRDLMAEHRRLAPPATHATGV